jgi:murein L,D-transpeptidase YcbB/YkuD
MNHLKNSLVIFPLFFVGVLVVSCNNAAENNKSKIVSNPEKIDRETRKSIQIALEYALENNGTIDDSITLQLDTSVNYFYTTINYENIWSSKEKWNPLADSLYLFLQNAALCGLYSNDYHFKNLQSLKNKLDNDSLKRMDATIWTKADLMLTDGYLHILKDLKEGRLNSDSISFEKKGVTESYYAEYLTKLLSSKQFTTIMNEVQPQNAAYWELKNSIGKFLDSVDQRNFTYVPYPYKKGGETDSISFIEALQMRLYESDCIAFTDELPDSLQLKTAIKKYQQQKKLKQDGAVTSSLVRSMNRTGPELFKRIAITLDKYKQLPDTMPEKYILVNLPGYYLRVWDHDTLVMSSKIICGKPDTRTPLLNSYITDMVTYPTWTVPTSIIAKQYLPKLKNNPNYLTKIGLQLVDRKGDTVNGEDIDWSKYKKGIPYKVMQMSGDDNALGILKFNFSNPFAVYLHDTNQRYLFKKTARDLSHGCVRVQEWDKLAFYLIRNDSLNLKQDDVLTYPTDSIKTWLARKENRRIPVKVKVPLFIRYFGCEAKDGNIQFYDDIYGEDKLIAEKYFAGK